MATPEESAKHILHILKRRNVKRGEVEMQGAIELEFLTKGGTADEFKEGMNFAIGKKWIEVEPSKVRLLKDG